MSTAAPELMTLDQLLEGSIDDLADIPEFKPYPVGVHIVKPKLEWKAPKSKDKSGGFMLMMEAIETRELLTPDVDKPLEKSAKAGEYYNLGNEYGQGGLKLWLRAAAAKWGGLKNGELIKKINEGSQAVVMTIQRADKENKQIVRTVVKEVSFDV